MVERLHVNLLGTPQVVLGGKLITGFATAKAEALLYYLAITGRPHRRETLTELFWGEMPEAKARRNLTTALSTLRKLVGPYLLIESQTIAFKLEAPSQVDVTIFQESIEHHTAQESHASEADLALLRDAVSLYKGDFLQGFYVKNAPAFEAWYLMQREQLRGLMLQGLHILVEYYSSQTDSELGTAVDYANQLLALEPWQESAHRQMMVLLARSGQRSAALAQYETCRHILAEELGAEPAAETTDLYERLKASQEPIPHNLPSPSNTFVGRVRELNQLKVSLDNPDCRLLTLVGPGGIGKTRMAIEGARRYVVPERLFSRETFADGVYFVDLAPLTVTAGDTVSHLSNLLSSAIADAIGYDFHGAADQMDQLHHYLRHKQMLLIMDNFEQLIEAATLIATLLQRSRNLKLLITSRERLNLLEEWILALHGLDFPNGGRKTVVADGSVERETERPMAENYSAVALFVEQARQIRGSFEATEAQTAQIIRICQLVDGIPLALVLAASWLRVLSCEEIVEEIEPSLDFLSASQRNIPERHRNLRAVFEYSWQMLSEQEQAVLQKISIFRGGFRRDAARKVVGATLPTLISLVDKSLLLSTGAGRYEVHELVRQYAAEKLAQTPAEQQSTEEKHGRYYIGLLKNQENGTSLGSEIANLRTGWRWAVAYKQETLIAQGMAGLFDFFWLRSRFQEGEETFAEAVKGISQSADKPLLACLKLRQGAFHGALGHYETAEALLNQALDTLQTIDAIQEAALALIYLGNTAWDQGRYEEAGHFYETSLSLGEQFEDPLIRPMALHGLGSIAGEASGDFDSAKAYFLESLELFRTAKNRNGIASNLDKLGLIAWALGDYEEAKVYYQESLEHFEESNNQLGISLALGGLGLAAWGEGGAELVQAKALYEKSLALCRETGQRGQLVVRLAVLGHICNALGAYELAQTHCRESISLGQEIDFKMGVSFAMSALGEAQAAQGSFDSARASLLEAIEIAATINSYSELLAALVNWVAYHLYEQNGNLDVPLGRQQQLANILTLTLNHPANRQIFRDKAGRLLTQLEPTFSEISTEKIAIDPDLSNLDTIVADILHADNDNRSYQ